MIVSYKECDYFRENGPTIDGINVLKRKEGRFVPIDDVGLEKIFSTEATVRIDIKLLSGALGKIATALTEGNFVDAAIRFAQLNYRDFILKSVVQSDLSKGGFDPTEPRDTKGRWTDKPANSSPSGNKVDDKKTVVVDPYCKLIKEMCLVNCNYTLPTGGDPFKFHICVNKCMDDHGCLGRA